METVLLSSIVKVAVASIISSRALRVISGKKEMGDLISVTGWLSVGLGIIMLINQSYAVVLDSKIIKIIAFIGKLLGGKIW